MNYFLNIFLFSGITLFSAAQDNNDEPELSISDYFEMIPLDLVDSTNIYLMEDDSDELFYLALRPKGEIKATLALFPSSWEPVQSAIFYNMELCELAYEQGVLVIVPSINFNTYLDESSIHFINTALNDVLTEFDPPADQVIFGGFSLGGINALRYAEIAYEGSKKCAVKPAAVYGVDPPLDYERLYKSFQSAIAKDFSEAAVYEATVFVEKLEEQLGEFPASSENYAKNSVYSKSKENGGNAIHLTSIPIRIYSDPDIDWHLENRRVDYYDINAIDQTALINQLRLLGNENAEYLNRLGKGFRQDGRRHPHSWSLVDPKECMEWIFECLK